MLNTINIPSGQPIRVLNTINIPSGQPISVKYNQYSKWTANQSVKYNQYSKWTARVLNTINIASQKPEWCLLLSSQAKAWQQRKGPADSKQNSNRGKDQQIPSKTLRGKGQQIPYKTFKQRKRLVNSKQNFQTEEKANRFQTKLLNRGKDQWIPNKTHSNRGKGQQTPNKTLKQRK